MLNFVNVSANTITGVTRIPSPADAKPPQEPSNKARSKPLRTLLTTGKKKVPGKPTYRTRAVPSNSGVACVRNMTSDHTSPSRQRGGAHLLVVGKLTSDNAPLSGQGGGVLIYRLP